MRLHSLAKFLVAVIACTGAASAQQSPTVPSLLPPGQAVQSYARVPMIFEANQGQTAGQVKFLSRGKGYSAFLTSGGMVLHLRAPRTNSSLPNQNAANSNARSESTTLQFQLVGGNQNPAIVGENQQPGRVNYFIGKDRSKWLTNVPTYARVRYKNVYPGVDLVYYGNHQQLEYDFAVAPGANPNKIQFEIKGAKQVNLDSDGDLVLSVNNATLHFRSPVVYQEANGQRTRVAGNYGMIDASHVGFQLANYDSSKPLIIDPVLVYSTYLGGTGTDLATGVAVDNFGSVYLTGYTDSANFPLATLGSLPAGSDHIFVAKFDSTGSNLVYADYIGGTSDDYATGIVLDNSDNIYVTGATTSNDFPIVNGYQSQQPGPYSGFLTKVSSDGSSLLYSSYLGGNTLDVPVSIAIDSLNEAHVAGYTMSTNFPTSNAYQSTMTANQSGYGPYGFITKFSADGSSLVYSTYFGGYTTAVQNCGSPCYPAPYNSINAVAVDANGNAFVTGETNSSNFPVTSGAYQTANSTTQANTLGFVSKFSSAGNLQYSTYFYGSSGNGLSPGALAVDDAGSVYVAGAAESDGTFPITSTGICDPATSGFACSYAFVSKFDPAVANLLYSTFLGPNNYASPVSVVLDTRNDAYILSGTSSAAFQVNNPIESYSGGNEMLLVELDPSGTTQLMSTYIGGSGDDFPSGLALDSQGNLYVDGFTDSPDFPTSSGAFQSASGGNFDAFVMKIGTASSAFVTLSPASLDFSAVATGSTSQEQTVLLRNMGSSALEIASIVASGDFAEYDTCSGGIPAAGSCTLNVTFTPTAVGPRSGSVTIQDNGVGAPNSIVLTGIGEGGSNSNPAPSAVLQPSSLTFSSVPVGRSGIPQSITLTNAGNASLAVSNLQITGDFAQTNNCSGNLTEGAACTITIVFTPTATGTRTGSFVLSDNAVGSPQTVTLLGIGSANAPRVSPPSLTFTSASVGQSSVAQVVSLTNNGSAPLAIYSIQATGDFSQTNSCASTLAAATSCTMNVVFTPTATGTRNGLLTISDNGQGGPQMVMLSGFGTIGDLVVAPGSLSFGTIPLKSSSSQTVTLTNTGNGSLTVSSIQITGDYAQTNNCAAVLTAGSSCTVTIVFTPTLSGVRSGNLTIPNSVGTPQIVSLSGTAADFTLSSSATEETVQAGNSATYTLTASAVGGSFSHGIKFACGGLPTNATCSFSPSTVTPETGKATTTLTIAVGSTTASNVPADRSHEYPMGYAWMQLQGLGALGIVLTQWKKSSRKIAIILLTAVLIIGMLVMTGCAGGTGIAPNNSSPTTTSQSYTVTITGDSGSLQHSLPVTLIVQ